MRPTGLWPELWLRPELRLRATGRLLRPACAEPADAGAGRDDDTEPRIRPRLLPAGAGLRTALLLERPGTATSSPQNRPPSASLSRQRSGGSRMQARSISVEERAVLQELENHGPG